VTAGVHQPDDGSGRWEMSKVLSCRDAGVDCDFVARGETEEDILSQTVEHAREAHGMSEIPPDLLAKVRSLIRDEAA